MKSRQTTRKILFIPVLLAITLCAVAAKVYSDRVRGNGNVKTQDRDAVTFNSISTSGVYKVYLQQGNTHSVKVEAEENLLPYIITDISGDELKIFTRRGSDIQPTKPVKVYVTLRELKNLDASGAGGFYGNGKLKGKTISLDFSGATDADLDIDANELKVELSGSSHIKLKGRAGQSKYDVAGASDIKAEALRSDVVEVDISGAGKVRLNAEKKLSIDASGASHIWYTGNAEVRQSVSGFGRITKE